MTLLDLAYQAGLQPKYAASTAGGEYHSECPICGGKDRFYIQPNKQLSSCVGYFRCRQCEVSGNTIEFCKQFLGWTIEEAMKAFSTKDFQPFRRRYFPGKSMGPLTTKKSAPPLWVAEANKLVQFFHENLLNQTEQLSGLEKRGLPLDALKIYKLGWNPVTSFIPKELWGITDGENKSLWFPKGLVIPSLDPDKNVVRLKIRRADWKDGDEFPKYIIISGSTNGMMVVNSRKRSVMVLVESELDALALSWAAGDFISAVAIGGSLKCPDRDVDKMARSSRSLIICPDNDDPGKKVGEKWKKLYAHARVLFTPYGKDIGEAIEKGLDIREWIRTNISVT